MTRSLRGRVSLGISSQIGKQEVGLCHDRSRTFRQAGRFGHIPMGWAPWVSEGASRSILPLDTTAYIQLPVLILKTSHQVSGKELGRGAPGVRLGLSGPPGSCVSLPDTQLEGWLGQTLSSREESICPLSTEQHPQISGRDPRSSSYPGYRLVELDADRGTLGELGAKRKQ